MDILIFIVAFLAWYMLSVWISVRYGKKYKIGEEWSFFLCLILSPVIGFLVTYFMGKKQQEPS
jgi:hypothetical protein